jgi:hypothetical protein
VAENANDTRRKRGTENSFCGGGVNETANGADTVCGKANAFGMFLDGGFVRSEIDAVDLVASDVTVEPLDFWAHAFQNVDGFLGDFAQLRIG